MRNQTTLMKMGLVVLFFVFSMGAYSQTLISDNDQSALRPPLSGTGTDPIFVYGDNGFTLQADPNSSADGGQSGIAFTNFDWKFRNAAGGADGVSSLTSATATPQGTNNNQLNVTGLSPGFYTFVAQGYTEDAVCSSPEQEFTVFVLAPLTVSVTSTGDLIYCTDDVASAPGLTATASYDATVWNVQTNLTSENPNLNEFQLRYRWYKIADGETFNIGTATPIATQIPTANSTSDTYSLIDANSDNAVGKWNYYVAVDYTVKTSGPYVNALGGVTDPTIIEVTPKPGKPTITISANP